MLRDAARAFCEAAGVANLRAVRDAGKPYDADLWAEMVAMGWAGVLVGEDEGGSDMGFAAANVLAEEMGRSLIASPFLSSAGRGVRRRRLRMGPRPMRSRSTRPASSRPRRRRWRRGHWATASS